ncbi:MAG: aminopeptidase P family N-terminal domain-containing protein, partial [Nocardioidaceae bacterium]
MESVPTPRNEPDLVGLGGASRPRWLTAESIGTVMGVEEPPFGDLEYQHRLSRVRARMVDASLDALVVFRPSSVEYLCGFHTKETTPQPLLLTHADSSLYVPDLEVGRA